MDNKITKSRLSNLFAYEWIIMIIVIVSAVIGLELVFSMTAARTSVGQQFTYFYDETIYGGNDRAFKNLLVEKKTFSYDVLEVNSETLQSKYNTMQLRLSVDNGDILITDISEMEYEGVKVRRANIIADRNPIYSMDDLLRDAKAYIRPFVNDFDTADLYAPSLNLTAIERNFNARMKKDNRYRFDELAKKEGLNLEIARIKDLCRQVADFEKLFEIDDSLPDEEKLFYSYRRYAETYSIVKDEEEKEEYKNKLAKEVEKRYALRVDRLSSTTGKQNTSEFFRKIEATTSKDVVIMAFNFKGAQPDLQYETISFINTVVRSFSDILD